MTKENAKFYADWIACVGRATAIIVGWWLVTWYATYVIDGIAFAAWLVGSLIAILVVETSLAGRRARVPDRPAMLMRQNLQGSSNEARLR